MTYFATVMQILKGNWDIALPHLVATIFYERQTLDGPNFWISFVLKN